MTDVQNDVQAEPVAEVTTPTPQVEEQPQEETKVEEVAQEAVERQVPISVLQKERKQRQEFQRKLAEIEGSQKLSQYDQADMETVMAHPYVQELLIKQAKQELTDYARQTLEEFPTLNPAVKKAILKNARGFVNETTTDVETAKLDLREYIEGILEGEAETQPTTPKTFPVAATNVAKTDVPGVRPAEIQKILEKPVDEWTEKETDAIDEYSKSHK